MNFQPEKDVRLRTPTNLGDAGLSLATQGQSFVASVSDGWDTLSGAVGSTAVTKFYGDYLDKQNGLAPVSKAEIDAAVAKGIDLGIEEDEVLYPTNFELRKQRFIKDVGRTTRINDSYAFTNFVGSALPELANPVNFVPFGKAASLLSKSSRLGKAGLPSKAAVLRARGKRFSAAFESFKQVGTEALIGNAIVEPLYYMDAKHRGRKYTMSDSILNVALGTAIGAGFFGSISAGLHFRETGRFMHSAQQFEELYSFMETGRFGEAANVAYKAFPAFRRALKKEAEFAEALEKAVDSDGNLRFDDLTDQQVQKLGSLLEGVYTRSLTDALTKAMSVKVLDDFDKVKSDVTIEKFSRDYRKQYERIHEAISQDDFSKLTPEDQKIVDEIVPELDSFFVDNDGAATSKEGSVNQKLQTIHRQRKKALRARQVVLDAARTKIDNLQEAVEKGEITQKQADDLTKKFEKQVKEGVNSGNVLGAVAKVRREIDFITNEGPAETPDFYESFIDAFQFKDVSSANKDLYDAHIASLRSLVDEVLPAMDATKYQSFLLDLVGMAELKDGKPQFISIEDFKARLSKYTEFVEDEVDDLITVGDILKDKDIAELHTNLIEQLNNLRRTVDQIEDPELKLRLRQSDESPAKVIKDHHREKAIGIANDALLKQRIRNKMSEFKTDKEKIKFLRTYLDGQERKGTVGEEGLENRIIAESQAACMPLLDVVFKYDLVELFMPDGSFGFFKAFTNRDNRNRWRMFGRNTKRASAEFHRQLHQALVQRELPDNWKGIEGLEALFDVIQATEFSLLTDLNNSGVRIGMIEDFGGVSQKWDVDIIKGMTKEEFVRDLVNKVDQEKTRKALGGKMVIDEKEVDFEVTAYLGAWYDRLISEQRVSDDVQVLDLEDVFSSRFVRIKTEDAVDVALKYSGYDSIGHLLLQQIQRRSALGVIARDAGTKPNKLLKELADELKVTGKSPLSDKGAYIATVNKLTGILENPVDVQLSRIGDTLQKFSNLVFLSGAGLSSLTDIPLMASTLEMQGIRFSENNQLFWETWKESMERKFQDPKAMKAYLLGMGAGFDIINNAVIRRLSDAPTGTGVFDRLNNLIFKVNGLNAFTATHQEMFVDILTRGMADELNSAKPTPEFITNLEEFGFTASEIKRLAKGTVKGPDGVTRIDPRALPPVLGNKLRRYITKYMRQAVIVPDIGTKAQFTGGFRKGTLAGESARVVTQYQSFSAAMTKLLFRRFANGSFGKTKDRAMMYKMSHLMAYIGTALAFGYMVTVLKDLAKGKDPMFLHNMTPNSFSRVVNQSGIIGILQAPLEVPKYGVSSGTSPLVGSLFGLAGDTVTGDVKGAFKELQTLTGANIMGPPQIIHAQIGEVFARTLNEIQLNELDNIED